MPEGCCVEVGGCGSRRIAPSLAGANLPHMDARFMMHTDKFPAQVSRPHDTGIEAMIEAVHKLVEKSAETQLYMGNRLEQRLNTIESRLLHVTDCFSTVTVNHQCGGTSVTNATDCATTLVEPDTQVNAIPMPAQVSAHQDIIRASQNHVGVVAEHPRTKALARRSSLISLSKEQNDEQERLTKVVDDTINNLDNANTDVTSYGHRTTLGASQRLLEKLHWRQAAHLVVSHPRFDLVIAAIVCFNSILLGLQVDHQARSNKELDAYKYMEWLCNFVYTAELALRVMDQGCIWCSGNSRWWMLFDAILVAISWLDLIAGLLFTQFDMGGGGAVPKLLKVTRLARIMRIVRMVRFLQPLRIMTGLIWGSMMQLMWLFLLLFGVMYVFAVVLTQGASDYRFSTSPRSSQIVSEVEKYFGNLIKSIYTLFLSMTGGVSWGEPADNTQQVGQIYWIVFLFFVFFIFFSVLNIVTGVFVDGAIQQANEDRATMIEKAMEIREQCAKSLADLLQEIDIDRSGYISREEWDLALANDKIIATMDGLQIDARQTEHLFAMLDHNSDQIVEIEEFVTGMTRLKGTAKAIDLHLLMSKVADLHQIVRALCSHRVPEEIHTSDSAMPIGDGPRAAMRLQNNLHVEPPVPDVPWESSPSSS